MAGVAVVTGASGFIASELVKQLLEKVRLYTEDLPFCNFTESLPYTAVYNTP